MKKQSKKIPSKCYVTIHSIRIKDEKDINTVLDNVIDFNVSKNNKKKKKRDN